MLLVSGLPGLVCVFFRPRTKLGFWSGTTRFVYLMNGLLGIFFGIVAYDLSCGIFVRSSPNPIYLGLSFIGIAMIGIGLFRFPYRKDQLP